MSTSTQSAIDDLTRARSVLSDACVRLLAEQQADGTWHGAIAYNAWTNGMFCIVQKVLGRPEPSQALEWLSGHRNGLDTAGKPNGTWGIIDTPSPSFLEGTIAAEIALEVWGRGRLTEPWAYIDSQASGRLANAISLADPFTQVLAVLASPYAPMGTGPYYDITEVLVPPLELLILPRTFKTSLPHLAGAWGQDALLALVVMGTVLSGRRLNLAERALLAKAEAQLLNDQNADGSWYDTFLPTMAGTVAMHLLGHGPDTDVMKRATAFLDRLERADGYVARYKLPVWDTSIAVLGLTTAGIDPGALPLRKAADYLLRCQTGDGGIPFQQENVPYPDTDDTSFAILALNRINVGEREKDKARVIANAVRWLIFMQGDDGGWAAFAKNQQKAIRGLLPVFKDDPPTADVTGHVLSALALGLAEPRQSGDRAARAIAWLESLQLDNGSWFGRWGLTFTYGTAAVLMALRDLAQGGVHTSLPDVAIDAAVDYLLGKQHDDGGWGEGYASYYDFNAPDTAPSTVEQTAWTICGLLAVPPTPRIDTAVRRGIGYLLASYDTVAGWSDAAYSVGAIWVYRNSLYPLLWGVWALAEYLKKVRPENSGTQAPPPSSEPVVVPAPVASADGDSDEISGDLEGNS